MSRTSNIPPEISKYRPCKSSRIRYDNDGTYRVYKWFARPKPGISPFKSVKLVKFENSSQAFSILAAHIAI